MTALNDGGFVVTWMSNGNDGSDWGVYGQRYAADGAASGNEFLINNHTSNTVNTNPLLQRSLMAGLWLLGRVIIKMNIRKVNPVFMPAVMSQAPRLLTVTGS